MWCHRTKYGAPLLPALALALFSYNASLYSQQNIPPYLSRTEIPDAISLSGNKMLSFSWTPSGAGRNTLIPSRLVTENRNESFFESLQAKASKYLITKKLYDLVIVHDHTSEIIQQTGSSQSFFTEYRGKTIRNITIKRLEVFGTSMDNPIYYNPGRTESFLNKTHLNTNEFIIRNNLLFSEGDTISPLTLSDNERLIRELPFIDECRIIVVPVSDQIVDILVITRDVYSLGADFEYKSISSGTITLFDKNILGLGHEFRLSVPYNPDKPDSPGFGIEYSMNNLRRTFISMNMFFFDGLGSKSYGFSLERKLVSATTRYAGGISVREMFTTTDLDTMSVPEPLKYNLQDYWLSRSILLNKESVIRLILGARYTNNNVFDHPFILPDSYHYLQKFRMYLGSVTLSMQKFYKTNLIYGYGRTEDIPYGGIITLTGGKEVNEFKLRYYAGMYAATGHSISPVGYFYTSGGISTFFNNGHTEQGMFLLRSTWFSNLWHAGTFKIRNFIMADYTRGFDRNKDEHLFYNTDDGFSGFSNDSVGGAQRLSINLESVLFSPANLYGFRFSFFAFGGLGYLFGTNEFVHQGEFLSAVGLGVRIRNDNLVFKTFQVRIGYFPNMPPYSHANYITVSGEQLLRPDNFDPGAPTILTYR